MAIEKETICQLFEKLLLYQISGGTDQWLNMGRQQFLSKLSYFVQRRQPILFCLPAFPCKSTNPEKTASQMPDGAEFEALDCLVEFCDDVKSVYPPGCYLDIVSDGHVFSDCIGTDDKIVTQYTKELHIMTELVCSQMRCCKGNPIRFHNLTTLLCPKGGRYRYAGPSLPKVLHPLSTKINKWDDHCREMLLAYCRSLQHDLVYVIKSDPKHALTKLYRGFSRFMCDDLRALQGVSTSAKQRERLASTVGLEMIQRNQAYSHLVELLMPRHIRLSIHAHNNQGPKFAVQLLPPAIFSPDQDTDPIAAQHQAKKLLHIPTPWHGTFYECWINNQECIDKAANIRARIQMENSPWSSRSHYDKDHPRGGRYILYPKEQTPLRRY